jgi:23S rRNA pseudouridine1911/1915/1917 synthase
MNEILYEDKYLLVLHKNFGIDVQKIPEVLDLNYNLVNRIDMRVSGLVILAKNSLMAQRLQHLLQKGGINKKYKAVCAKALPNKEGKLSHFLLHQTKNQRAFIFEEAQKNAKEAILNYQLVDSSQKYFLYEIEIQTGRFHQIRAQLAHMGSPIVGDLKYGAKRSSPDGSIFLQAFALSFVHPISQKPLSFELEIPQIWKKYGF